MSNKKTVEELNNYVMKLELEVKKLKAKNTFLKRKLDELTVKPTILANKQDLVKAIDEMLAVQKKNKDSNSAYLGK